MQFTVLVPLVTSYINTNGEVEMINSTHFALIHTFVLSLVAIFTFSLAAVISRNVCSFVVKWFETAVSISFASAFASRLRPPAVLFLVGLLCFVHDRMPPSFSQVLPNTVQLSSTALDQFFPMYNLSFHGPSKSCNSNRRGGWRVWRSMPCCCKRGGAPTSSGKLGRVDQPPDRDVDQDQESRRVSVERHISLFDL